MKKQRTFHKDNCESKVRKVALDINGDTIVLTGTHAFDWSVNVVNKRKATIVCFSFSKRKKAMKEYNRLKVK